MLARRLIPCLDVKDGRVVKGVRFRGHEVVGEAVELARRYREAGADELVFYDISASPADRAVDTAWIDDVARDLDIPFCVAGGIRSVGIAEQVLAAGADKISVNSPALEQPALIDELAARLGSQCVVVGVDSLYAEDAWRVHQYTGDPERSRASGRQTLDWVDEVQDRGAGEVVLNCMDTDGVRAGYDIEQLAAVRERLTIPLVASGGAGCMVHFAEVFRDAGVDGALAASVFHAGEISIPELKSWLAERGIPVRITEAV